MNDNQSDSNLHLPDLLIENFRGIKGLSIPRLGGVTLLAGHNGVGKTTVLEAIKVYAARARYAVLQGLLTNREEFSGTTDEDGANILEPDWGALFYGRDTTQNSKVFVGPKRVQDRLSLETISLSEPTEQEVASLGGHLPDLLLEGEIHTIKVVFQENEWLIPAFFFQDQRASTVVGDSRGRMRDINFRVRRQESSLPPPITCEEIGPGLMSNNQLSRSWDNVALTEDEIQATLALSLIYGADVERVAVVGDDRSVPMRGGRRAIVRLKSNHRPVPLKSLGDGALRLFGVALALANSRDGFLLIDEAENGIHHSVQRDFWRMVMRTAHENNVQVFATTHSWDCVRGFALAAVENENVEGVLVRLEKEDEGLRAVRYSERRLRIVAEQRTEVR